MLQTLLKNSVENIGKESRFNNAGNKSKIPKIRPGGFYRYLIRHIRAVQALAFIIMLASCSQNNTNDFTEQPLRILFIGNSLTHYNGGLDYQMKKLFQNSSPKLQIYSEKIAPGGERLSAHYRKGKALRKIKDGGWDIVVLQEYSNGPIINKEDFFKYSKLFYREIKRTGAATVFYMTFCYKDNPDMTPMLANSYKSVASELKCEVVPVGIAWQKVLNDNKNIGLYSDFKHPSEAGTFLAACVFYSFLTGTHPETSSYNGGLKESEAEYLRNIAWQTVVEWKKK